MAQILLRYLDMDKKMFEQVKTSDMVCCIYALSYMCIQHDVTVGKYLIEW